MSATKRLIVDRVDGSGEIHNVGPGAPLISLPSCHHRCWQQLQRRARTSTSTTSAYPMSLFATTPPRHVSATTSLLRNDDCASAQHSRRWCCNFCNKNLVVENFRCGGGSWCCNFCNKDLVAELFCNEGLFTEIYHLMPMQTKALQLFLGEMRVIGSRCFWGRKGGQRAGPHEHVVDDEGGWRLGAIHRWMLIISPKITIYLYFPKNKLYIRVSNSSDRIMLCLRGSLGLCSRWPKCNSKPPKGWGR